MHLDVCASKIGFTLAEVLITLGIIGVVAALTLPTLIQNYQKKQTVTQLKKAYAEIQQAMKLSEAEHGEMSGWNVGISGDIQANFKEYIVQYFKTVKTCLVSEDKSCFSDVYNLNGDKYSYINISSDVSSYSHFAFITASGYSVYMWFHNNENGGWFYVDLNGPQKGPATLGKDVFVFTFRYRDEYREADNVTFKSGIYPFGLGVNPSVSREALLGNEEIITSLQTGLCKKTNKSIAGALCSAVILMDGWEISPDYPW